MVLRSMITAILILSILGGGGATAAESGKSDDTQAVDVCQAYFQAMDNSDLDAAEALFAKESFIFETGGVEGSWENYRAHHLGPEIDAVAVFETVLGEPRSGSSEDGTMTFVAWPIEYHIELKDDRKIDSRGTVTFVLSKEDGKERIRHLHWSSRRKK